MARGLVAWGAALAAVLVLASAAWADAVVTGGKVVREKRAGVTATVRGTFAADDFTIDPFDVVTFQTGTTTQDVIGSRFRRNGAHTTYTFKGGGGSFVRKATFNFKSGKFTLSMRSPRASDYASPLHVSIRAAKLWAFEIPLSTRRRQAPVHRTAGETPGGSLGGGTLGANGGTLDVGGVQVTASAGSLRGDLTFDVAPSPLPGGLPAGVRRAGQAYDIDAGSGAPVAEEPLTITLGYDPGTAGPEDLVAVLHYDAVRNAYDPTTIVGMDTDQHTVTVSSRAFSVFVPVTLADAAVPDAYTVPGFDPDSQGWAIRNFGSYFSPGGNCLGMSAYCVWFFGAHGGEELSTTYTGTAATIVATRAHLAQSQYWAHLQFDQEQAISAAYRGRIMKAYIALLGEPMTLLLFGQQGGGHATVAYGYDDAGILFYEVNRDLGDSRTQTVPFDGTSFGTYGPYTDFGFVALPSLGRNQDFQSLHDDAESGFQGGRIHITSPTPGENVDTRSVTVTGTVDESAWDQFSIYAGGARLDGTIVGGSFQKEVPLIVGTNTIVVVAGTSLADQSAFVPGSGVTAFDVECGAAAADLLVTLEWNQNDTDVDLYVHEPGGDVAWYADQTTATGGALDVDDVDGYGPEHYTISSAEDGAYTIRVHYFSDHGTSQGVSGSVTVLLNEGAPDRRSQRFPFSIGPSSPANDSPGSVGSDWVDIATVNPVQGTIGPPTRGLRVPPQPARTTRSK